MKRNSRQTVNVPVNIVWTRADPAALATFDPRTKQCTMNCGPALGDPRSKAERMLLCDDCLDVKPPHVHHWRDYGMLGGRNVVWCAGCDALAWAGDEARHG